MAKILNYYLLGAHEAGVTLHAQKQLKELGISYKLAVPQSIADMWQFWLPEGDLDNLPDYIQVSESNPMDHIGYGLSHLQAESLATKDEINKHDGELLEAQNEDIEEEEVTLYIGGVKCEGVIFDTVKRGWGSE